MRSQLKVHTILIFAAVLFSCLSCKKDPYDPAQYLSQEEQQKLVRQAVYYCTKLPPNGTEESKFGPQYTRYYDLAAAEASLIHYTPMSDGRNYFMIARQARSIEPMQEGIAGRISIDESGKLKEYEEIFRTWKQPADTLVKRGRFLYDRMIKGGDLKLYYSRYQGDRFIEFPDDRFTFDKKTLRWKDAALDTLNVR